MLGIVPIQGVGVAKNGGSFLERDAVLLPVAQGLPGVPGEHICVYTLIGRGCKEVAKYFPDEQSQGSATRPWIRAKATPILLPCLIMAPAKVSQKIQVLTLISHMTRNCPKLVPAAREVMATIEVRCNVKLPKAIVLATRQDAFYGAICWTLSNGDTVAVEMDIPEDEIRRSYQQHSSRGDWWVNSRVEDLRISIRLENVSADDLDRLYARHTSERTWVAHFETSAGVGLDQSYQEAPELGRRAVAEIRETVNLILRFVRDNYGQHWLRLLSQDEKSL